MKWFRNKEMLQGILEQNKNELEKYKNDKIVALLKDESNLIQDHLELLDEVENLKKHNARLQRKCERLEKENYTIHNERLILSKNNESLMEAIKLIKRQLALSNDPFKRLELLEEIIKENFGYSETTDRVFFNYTEPVMENEIKEVLGDA